MLSRSSDPPWQSVIGNPCRAVLLVRAAQSQRVVTASTICAQGERQYHSTGSRKVRDEHKNSYFSVLCWVVSLFVHPLCVCIGTVGSVSFPSTYRNITKIFLLMLLSRLPGLCCFNCASVSRRPQRRRPSSFHVLKLTLYIMCTSCRCFSTRSHISSQKPKDSVKIRLAAECRR